MFKTIALALVALSVAVSAADVIGVWKLNAAKSKYTGMTANKELTTTYTKQGAVWTYEAKGVSATGEAIDRSYTYVKDGEEAKTTGFPHWDGLVVRNGATNKSTLTMTIKSSYTLPEGRKATLVSVFERQ